MKSLSLAQMAAQQAGVTELTKEFRKIAAAETASFKMLYTAITSWHEQVRELADQGVTYTKRQLVEVGKVAGLEALSIYTIGRWEDCCARWASFPEDKGEQRVLQIFLTKRESQFGLKQSDLPSATPQDLEDGAKRKKQAREAAKAAKSESASDPDTIKKMVQNSVLVAVRAGHAGEIESWVRDAIAFASTAAAA